MPISNDFDSSRIEQPMDQTPAKPQIDPKTTEKLRDSTMNSTVQRKDTSESGVTSLEIGKASGSLPQDAHETAAKKLSTLHNLKEVFKKYLFTDQ